MQLGFGDTGVKSIGFLGTVGTVVRALTLMGSALLLGVVLTLPLFCGIFGVLSSLDKVDGGEFEC